VEAAAVPVPVQDRARRSLGHDQDLRLFGHVFDEQVVALHVLAAEHHRVRPRQRGF
jgi:hypothetical protein